MNEVYDEEGLLAEFDSENGICHVIWDEGFWKCIVHDISYYPNCAENPDLAQNEE